MNDQNETTVSDALSILYRDYFAAVRSIADEALSLAKSGEIADDEALSDWLHESIDGHQRVIYTYKAKLVLICTDNPDAYADDFGAEGLVKSGAINWEGMAYAAMLADVRALLDDVQYGPDDENDDDEGVKS